MKNVWTSKELKAYLLAAPLACAIADLFVYGAGQRVRVALCFKWWAYPTLLFLVAQASLHEAVDMLHPSPIVSFHWTGKKMLSRLRGLHEVSKGRAP